MTHGGKGLNQETVAFIAPSGVFDFREESV